MAIIDLASVRTKHDAQDPYVLCYIPASKFASISSHCEVVSSSESHQHDTAVASEAQDIWHYLSTNTPFIAASERSRVSKMIDDCTEELEKCASICADLNKLQNNILTRREKLQARIRELRWLTAPLRTLPNETLHDIFSYATAKGCVINDSKLDLPTVRLSQVCSRWRNQIVSSPSLWNRLAIKLSDVDEVQEEDFYRKMIFRYKQAISSILQRLGNATLRLKLWVYPGDGEIDFYEEQWDDPRLERFSDYVTKTIKLMVSSSNRWRSLSIHVEPVMLDDLLAALSSVKGKLDSLETLKLDLDFGPERQFNATGLKIFSRLPSLRSVVLRKDVEPDKLPLLWTAIRDLVVREPGCPYHILAQIHGSQCLEELELNDFQCFRGTEMDPARKVLLYAKTLKIFYNGDHDLDPELLSSIQLPQLASLHLAPILYIQDEPAPLSPIGNLLPLLSLCSLTSLCWIDLKVTPTEFLRLLHYIPSLRVLDIRTMWDTKNPLLTADPFFPRLQITPDQEVLVPLLEDISITVYNRPNETFPHSAFLAMASSRTQNLRSLELKVPNEVIPIVDRESYLALSSRGVKVMLERRDMRPVWALCQHVEVTSEASEFATAIMNP